MTFWIEALSASVRYYDAGGVRTRVIEAGEGGPPVVLMHGLSGHAESFIRNVVPLSAAGYHVYAVDAIGHGFSSKPADVTYHSPAFERHLLDVLEAIGAESAHLIGQSLGAWTAWRVALAHPGRVRSLTSATGAGILLGDEAAKEQSEEIHKRVGSVTARALEEPTRERVRARLQWLMASPDRVTDELVETRYRIFNLPDSRAVMGKVSAEQTSDANRANLITEDDLARTEVPVLLLWTDKNPTVPASVAERAARIVPGARFELIEGAGHWPQFEQPDEFHRIVLDFLAGV